MTASIGPNTIKDGLILSLDAANERCISPLGNNSFNGAQELAKNLISPDNVVESVNGVKIGNLDFYTIFAIDYPESNFGGDAANRQGITPGLNVRSGTKLYDATRSLHFWVWDTTTESWLSSSFFNGARLNGHCYDSYDSSIGSSEVAQFVTDYNNIKLQFPEATYIMMGSHKDSRHPIDKINVMLDVGAPSNVASLLDGDPEWILIGKPGLGPDNAYGWAFENYTTDPTKVAHLNFGLPIYGGPNNYFSLDGINQSINIEDIDLRQDFTYECWVRHNTVNGFAFLGQGTTTTRNGLHIWFRTDSSLRFGMYSNDSDANSLITSTGVWYQYCFTYSHSTFEKKIYRNGVELQSTPTGTQSSYLGTGVLRIGATYSSGGAYANGDISNARLYNKTLSNKEISQNFNANRGRFGI